MLKKCTNADKEQLVQYIGNEYGTCLYLYMDLLQYGPDSEYTSTWLQEENGDILCVILCYHTAMHIYSRSDIKVDEVIDLVKTLNPSQICAAKSIILSLKDALSAIGYDMELGFVGRMEFTGQTKSTEIKMATLEDVDEIAELLYLDEGIGASYSLEDLKSQFTERLTQGFVRSYIIKHDGRIVAHLGTGAEIGNVCIITYVITDKEYRGRGYAKMLYQVACSDLQQDGKEIYAVYYTDGAIHLHHSVGFRDCCEYGKLFTREH